MWMASYGSHREQATHLASQLLEDSLNLVPTAIKMGFNQSGDNLGRL